MAELSETPNKVDESLKWISRGPSLNVFKYHSYNLNGTQFNTMERDKSRRTQNHGVSIVAKTFQVSSSKDKNPVECDMTYYGVIKEIWELDYVNLKIPLFLCDWVKNDNGMKKESFRFTLVDLN